MLISNKKDTAKFYKALIEKDSQYVGIFFVGVKTTGIFCISTCTARKPKFENVIFHSTSKELLQFGYRPCKICKPTNYAYEPPDEVIKAIKMINSKPDEKITDYQLKLNNLSPEKIRRWFKKHHGYSFQTYQRMIRINTAYQQLKAGKDVTSSAFESGYDSLSGFGYTFKTLMGVSPNQSQNKSIILINRLNTPLGPMFACATEVGLCLLEFTDRRMLETELRDLQKRLNAVIISGENMHITKTKSELNEYFSGQRKQFTIQLHTPGTDFQNSVWSLLQEIPYGVSRSYQEQAMRLNKPTAIRAVASANGFNRISIIIPCHRVIGKDGNLTGYGGGLERKRWLLEHEKEYNF